MRPTLFAALLTSACLLSLPSLAQTLASAALPSGLPAPQQAKSPAIATREQAIAGMALLRIAADYFDAYMALYPMLATELSGDARYEGQLTISIAPRHRGAAQALHRGLLTRLRGVKPAELTEADQLSLAILRQQAQSRLDELGLPTHLLPIAHYGGMPVRLADYASGQSAQPLKTVANYDHFLQRLAQLPAWNSQSIVNMREGLRRGIVQPRPIIERALQTLRQVDIAELDKNPYYQPIVKLPADWPAADRDRLTTAYAQLVRQKLQPSIRDLLKFLETEYLPRTRSTAGIGALPGGQAWYKVAVRNHTTTALSPAEIHALGLSEVARIRAEMAQIQSSDGFTGSLTDFLREHNKRPEFRPFKTDQEVLDRYAQINQSIERQLPQLFVRAPRAGLIIRPEPELTRATASAHYEPPPMDGSRPGVFYAPIMDPLSYSTTAMTSLLLHEGQPGHHFQMALQNEMPLPAFRKYGWITAYGEGWALYAETLGHEMGLYANDRDAYLGHLSLDLMRAVRLVTDTGLHAMGWSREKTMAYMMDTEGIDEGQARRATERYMVDPGQALGYKIGAMKIRALRDKAQAQLGPRFSLAEFHNQVLADGGMPLDLLDAKISRWLARQAAP